MFFLFKSTDCHGLTRLIDCLETCGVWVVKLMGDGSMLEFTSVVDAVRFAVFMQSAVAEDASDNIYRIGINIGDVIAEDEDQFGDDVNIVARLEPLADSGGICISHSVYTQVVNKLDLDFEAMGAQVIKNIPSRSKHGVFVLTTRLI